MTIIKKTISVLSSLATPAIANGVANVELKEFENPNTWQTNSTVRAIKLNCLLETAYTQGLVKFMVGWR
ncbi:MAG: hypothetical protein QXY19_03750 [Archaeoglobaceae archaeon]